MSIRSNRNRSGRGIRVFSAFAAFAVILATGIWAQQPAQAPTAGRGARGHFDMSKLVPPMEETGFKPIFDGKSLNGWDCDTDFWRVENDAIVGESKLDHQPKQNIFCIWKGGQPADFELRLQYRMTGTNDGNSGIQYRSIERPDVAKWVLQGYQADIDLKQTYTGQIYEDNLLISPTERSRRW